MSSQQTNSAKPTRSQPCSVEAKPLRVLENPFWRVGILPGTGASIAFGQIRHGADWVDFMRPTPESSYNSAPACASYALIPWSNRVRDGLFRFRETCYRLRINCPDGTAIHGTANEFPWAVEAADETRLVARFDSGEFCGVNFPWRFSARVTFRLDGERFTVTASLKNEDRTAMPAGFGHHPYFLHTLASPTDTVQLEIPCAQYFELEKCLPVAEPVPVEPRVDFRALRPLGSAFIDDCLTGGLPGQPIRFVYGESGRVITLHADEIFQNVVLYVPQGQPFFAVEPGTNANDGFNLYDTGIPGSGVFVLEPGEEKQGALCLEIEQ
jgi:aldose 1-epimerase